MVCTGVVRKAGLLSLGKRRLRREMTAFLKYLKDQHMEDRLGSF